MAERRYSESDKAKITQDGLAELRARGIDAQDIHPIHPGGSVGAIKEMMREVGFTRDQSQQQVEESREQTRNLGKKD